MSPEIVDCLGRNIPIYKVFLENKSYTVCYTSDISLAAVCSIVTQKPVLDFMWLKIDDTTYFDGTIPLHLCPLKLFNFSRLNAQEKQVFPFNLSHSASLYSVSPTPGVVVIKTENGIRYFVNAQLGQALDKLPFFSTGFQFYSDEARQNKIIKTTVVEFNYSLLYAETIRRRQPRRIAPASARAPVTDSIITIQ